jgi:hypothetical protein
MVLGILLAAIFGFFGRLVGGVYLLVVNVAGAPGALMTLSPRRWVRGVGTTFSLLGMSCSLVAFTALAIWGNCRFMTTTTYPHFPFWVEAFVVSYSPVWYGYVEIRQKEEAGAPLSLPLQLWGLTSYVVIIAFGLLAFLWHGGRQ